MPQNNCNILFMKQQKIITSTNQIKRNISSIFIIRKCLAFHALLKQKIHLQLVIYLYFHNMPSGLTYCYKRI